MKLLVLGTGGTIASAKTEMGYKAALSADDILQLAGIRREDGAKIETRDILNLDSTLIQPEDWVTIGRAVFEAFDEYDGIVITHGTDTLAYTSSALSFMIRNPPIPVVLTGSMLPITEPNSDAPRNLRTALTFARKGFPGIYVAFMDKIMLGTRVSKVHSLGLNAFQSINYPDIAYVKGDEVLVRHKPRIGNGEPLFDPELDPNVVHIRLTPGLSPEVLRAVARATDGIVLEGYGAGGIPYRGRNLLEVVSETAREKPVVMTTQALYGGVDLTRYEVGRRALEAGVIPAGDMTKEATLTKLMWALGHTRDLEEIRKIMERNIAGEITGS
ncbi:L-asparaginase [Thermococcus kodakarensis KOD1]|uniref:L-asparaginase n=1 Tax=Thermococcus kodakarensis (strain ATCC BAA-918 / JCM 12380 / KOD1) TaxID=69014 RepID=ASPG_THEKO|nr:asparaginase [Thermococcus kodakarensis]5OT0_A Chain A, L-asparaginase [Thermococcus kodakarensis KOD1]5OT0_B Chain B, L-asparaginase [Thermococcus kodakarensis KOD1]5OT0_C Chain C, L-asparaginase [Thermococcus kodakarensis KOD1]5OT0_D Chain D, L-asparaginase [Thermococcus kodakarensis KOD1]5OT0_E Chain E, L-asparaginase [Thermococcus kodakarensis KOD1]5OT0_F Chain F, L-asparaginase [Thermococcus kodakarensis KOD1]WCN27583.1 asparaginase [Thermococcus kodakarensis]WCN29874.1 asparaginase